MPDTPPANQQGETAPAPSGYRGKYGAIKRNISATYGGIGMALGGPVSPDGLLFLNATVEMPDVWIEWGKADPRYMAFVQMFWGGPWMILIGAHLPLGFGLMANHGIKVPRLFNPLAGMNALADLRRQAAGSPGMVGRGSNEGSPNPVQPPVYEPVGAYAPTQDAGPPAGMVGSLAGNHPSIAGDGLRVYPDEGLTSEEEAALRQAARRAGFDGAYEQIKQAYVLQRAQERMAANGRVTQPGTLGAPVAKE